MSRKIFCKTCNKRCSGSTTGYCKQHSPTHGKYQRTDEHKKKMSEIFKGRKMPWIEGKKRPEHSKFLKEWWANHPEERKKAKERGDRMVSDKAYLKKLSELLSGDKNPAWKGGIAVTKYKGFYQTIKNKIRERDNYTCQLCGQTEEELQYRMSVNHINFNKEDCREENLNCLCKRCNSLINFERERWTTYFQQKFVNMTGSG